MIESYFFTCGLYRTPTWILKSIIQHIGKLSTKLATFLIHFTLNFSEYNDVPNIFTHMFVDSWQSICKSKTVEGGCWSIPGGCSLMLHDYKCWCFSLHILGQICCISWCCTTVVLQFVLQYKYKYVFYTIYTIFIGFQHNYDWVV